MCQVPRDSFRTIAVEIRPFPRKVERLCYIRGDIHVGSSRDIFLSFSFFLSSSSSSSSVLPLPHLFFKDKVGRKIFNSFLSARIDLFAREYFRPFLSWENL